MQIDRSGAGGEPLNSSIRHLAEVRWRTSRLVQKTLAQTLSDEGEWMAAITDELAASGSFIDSPTSSMRPPCQRHGRSG